MERVKGKLRKLTATNLSNQSLIGSYLSQRDSQDSKSIISDEFLKDQDLDKIKESKVKATDKSVIKWTPVVLGKQFPTHVNKIKFEYNTGRCMNSGEIPVGVRELQGGIIINLPLENIEQTLKRMISIDSLLTDDQLIQQLELFLDKVREQKGKSRNVQS